MCSSYINTLVLHHRAGIQSHTLEIWCEDSLTDILFWHEPTYHNTDWESKPVGGMTKEKLKVGYQNISKNRLYVVLFNCTAIDIGPIVYLGYMEDVCICKFVSMYVYLYLCMYIYNAEASTISAFHTYFLRHGCISTTIPKFPIFSAPSAVGYISPCEYRIHRDWRD